MDTRIELERRGREPGKVTQLTLDNCRSTTTIGISEKLAAYSGLNTLSMINAGLTSLKGFPSLPVLRKLDISDNRLTGGLNHIAESCPRLEFLNLGGNRIKDLETLEPLKQLKELKHLDMYNCDVTQIEDYQEKIFQLLPQLNDLDGYDREKKEVFEEDDEEDFGEEGDDDEEEGGESGGENDVQNGAAESDSNDLTNGADDHDDDEEEDDDDEEDDDADEISATVTPVRDLRLSNPPVEEEDEDDDDDDDDDDDEEDDVEEEDDQGEEDDQEENGDDDDDEADHSTHLDDTPGGRVQRGTKRVHSDDEEDEEDEDAAV